VHGGAVRAFCLAAALLCCSAFLGASPARAFTLLPGEVWVGTTEDAAPVVPTGSAALQLGLPDLLLTISGQVSFPVVIVAADPFEIDFPAADIVAGTSIFTLPLDLTVPVSGVQMPLVIQGTLVFSQVPEPALVTLLGVAALASRRARRG
jgi:hypothetical protein